MLIIITNGHPPNSELKLAAECLDLRIALPNRFGMESVILHTKLAAILLSIWLEVGFGQHSRL